MIRPRVANPMAVDSWQDQGVHFFVFQLHPAEGKTVAPGDPPVVVFAMHPEEPGPVSAVVVTPKPGGDEAEVVDLRQAGSAYTAAYPGAGTDENPPDAIPRQTGEAETTSGQTVDADLGLIGAIKASPEFQTIQSRLTQSLPAEAWQAGDAHFFAFELLPADGSPPNGHEPPVAVFALQPSDRRLISAVVVTPDPGGQDADVVEIHPSSTL